MLSLIITLAIELSMSIGLAIPPSDEYVPSHSAECIPYRFR